MPLTCHVTAVLVDPETVAVKDCVAIVASVITLGEIVTLTWAMDGVARPATIRTARAISKRRCGTACESLLVFIPKVPPGCSFGIPNANGYGLGFEYLRMGSYWFR